MSEFLAVMSQQEPWVQVVTKLSLLFLVALVVNFVLKKVILRAAAPIFDRLSPRVDSAAAWLATVAPLLVISRGIVLVPYLPEDLYDFVTSVARSLIAVSVAMAIVRMLSYANEVYERRPDAGNRPIKGFLQVIKILVLSGAAITIVSILIDQSPLILLSGLGAITAVLLLVFKDTLLSLVASVQLTTQDMLRIGDWIEMKDMNADGDVIDISLHTVTVQNFDKTITYIPTHRLVSDSYRNWRGMREAGARRIKRSLMIDQTTVRFLSDEEVVDLKKFKMLNQYLADMREEIAEWNERELSGEDSPVNARRLTNIGVLRAYVIAYLNWHPDLNTEKFTMLVRQLQPGAQGLPLEIYCFTNTTVWAEYESIQADIFDHLIAILCEFDLKLFQEPSGQDVRELPPGKGAS